MGIPTVAVVTGAFEVLARMVAKNGGVPDLPLLVLPDDISYMGSDGLLQVAADQVGAVVAALTQD